MTLSLSVTLFQILQTGLLPFQDGAHTTQSGSLQLFAAVQRISILHQTHIVFGNTAGLKQRRLITPLVLTVTQLFVGVVAFHIYVLFIISTSCFMFVCLYLWMPRPLNKHLLAF